MSLFIAIVNDDFLTFADNNNAEESYDFTKTTDYPIFTGDTIKETRDHVENYFRTCFEPDEEIPQYEIHEITTAAIVKGAYKLAIDCSYVND